MIKTYDDFHAYVTQHLKRINRGKYHADHFIDALYYDTVKDSKRLVIVLTEENFLLVDAKSKDLINELPSASLKEIKKGPNMTFLLYNTIVRHTLLIYMSFKFQSLCIL